MANHHDSRLVNPLLIQLSSHRHSHLGSHPGNQALNQRPNPPLCHLVNQEVNQLANPHESRQGNQAPILQDSLRHSHLGVRRLSPVQIRQVSLRMYPLVSRVVPRQVSPRGGRRDSQAPVLQASHPISHRISLLCSQALSRQVRLPRCRLRNPVVLQHANHRNSPLENPAHSRQFNQSVDLRHSQPHAQQIGLRSSRPANQAQSHQSSLHRSLRGNHLDSPVYNRQVVPPPCHL